MKSMSGSAALQGDLSSPCARNPLKRARKWVRNPRAVRRSVSHFYQKGCMSSVEGKEGHLFTSSIFLPCFQTYDLTSQSDTLSGKFKSDECMQLLKYIYLNSKLEPPADESIQMALMAAKLDAKALTLDDCNQFVTTFVSSELKQREKMECLLHDELKDDLKPLDFGPLVQEKRNQYMPGTRVWIFKDAKTWLANVGESRVFWLAGDGGTVSF